MGMFEGKASDIQFKLTGGSGVEIDQTYHTVSVDDTVVRRNDWSRSEIGKILVVESASSPQKAVPADYTVSDFVLNSEFLNKLQNKVDKQTYELIETITVSEITNLITRSAEPNGTAYSFDRVVVKIKTGISATSSNFAIMPYNGGTMLTETYLTNVVNENSSRYCIAEIFQHYGLWAGETWNQSVGNTKMAGVVGYDLTKSVATYPVINNIKIGYNLPIGTEIEIWGCRHVD